MPVKDDSLVAQYIRAIENPDSTGYRNGRWYKPTEKGYDPNNRGFGVDIVKNDAAASVANNRTGKWLSEEEERNLRQNHLDYVEYKLNKWTAIFLSYYLQH